MSKCTVESTKVSGNIFRNGVIVEVSTLLLETYQNGESAGYPKCFYFKLSYVKDVILTASPLPSGILLFFRKTSK